MKVYFFIAALLVSFAAKAHPDSLYSAQDIKADLKLLVEALKEAHPGLYRYNSPTSFDAYAADLLSTIEQPMREHEAFPLISKMIAGIRDGHTWTTPSIASMQNTELLPIYVRVAQKRVFVKYDLSSTANNLEGLEVETINGLPVSKILDRIYQHLPADGDIETGKKFKLEDLGFSEWYQRIEGTKYKFQVEVRDSTDALRTVIMNSATPPEISARMLAQDAGFFRYEEALHLAMLPQENAALMEIKSFHPKHIRKGHQNYRRFLRNSFKKIRKGGAQTLIIDLRENVGGETMYASDLYRYLTTSEFRWYERVELSTIEPFSFSEYTDLKRSFRNRPKDYQLADDGKYIRSNHRTLDVQKPVRKPFTGKLIVLTSGQTFSAAAGFCSVTKHAKRGEFVGEETGGAEQVFSAGGTPILTLPNTGIRIQIPLINVIMAVDKDGETGRGIQPDHPITVNIGAQDDNAALEKAIELARSYKR